jgi:hypothetical protein
VPVVVRWISWSVLVVVSGCCLLSMISASEMIRTDESDCAWRLAVSELFLREREGVTPGGHDGLLSGTDNGWASEPVKRSGLGESKDQSKVSKSRVSNRW